MASNKVVTKFRGCLLGGLIGDCYGAPFEWDGLVSKIVLTNFLANKLDSSKDKKVKQILPYTDDTEMARSVAESLMQKKKFHAKDIATRFAEEYYRPSRPKRNYGTFVSHVFKSFKQKDYSDIFEPAQIQFNGMGSFGNGAAMRTHPIALFCYKCKEDKLIEVCRQVARLTHAHMDGINGAILQTLAVRQALEADPSAKLDTQMFLDRLEKTMNELEARRTPDPKYPSLSSQIEKIRNCLKKTMEPEEVGQTLGNHITAVLSVPSAIYCFLRSFDPLPQYETDNPFVRTLYLSIALGGDTDTIANMACSIAGAFYGTELIPEILYQQCEAYSEIMEQADRMAKVVGVV